MSPTVEERATVRLERVISASPDRVYRAWLDPDLIRRWLAPGDLKVTRAEVEERVGGHYRIWQGDADGDVGGFEGELLELVPDQRIVFRLRFVGPDRDNGPSYDTRLTVTVAAAPNGATLLTLVHERLEELIEAAPHIGEKVGRGWEITIDKLVAALAS